jgi:hypothetical protein
MFIADIKLTKIRVFLCLLVIWLITVVLLVYRVNTAGAYASLGFKHCLDYLKAELKVDPSSVRLNQSYVQWALALNGSDSSNYIKTGLGFADGKGLNYKNITAEEPDKKSYIPYYYQGPGVPIIIGTMIKLFGAQSVEPYFILVVLVHLATTLGTCILASEFFTDRIYILGAGILSLLFPAALDYNFAAGLFTAEPFAALLLILALIAISNFWRELDQLPYSYKKLWGNAISYGVILGLVAYFRDIYASFAIFSFVIITVVALIKRHNIKRVLSFVLIGYLALSAVEYPWQKRNEKYFSEFTMSGANYGGVALWHQTWSDYRESAKWNPHGAMGLGNYLAPEKSQAVFDALAKNKQSGNRFAWQSFIEVIIKKPLQAFTYKVGVLDNLWFGERDNLYIYCWCLFSYLSLLIFLYLTQFKFIPAIWIFPMFLFCIAAIAHYEHRYAQPLYLFITPITVMYLIQYYRNLKNRSSLTD